MYEGKVISSAGLGSNNLTGSDGVGNSGGRFIVTHPLGLYSRANGITKV